MSKPKEPKETKKIEQTECALSTEDYTTHVQLQGEILQAISNFWKTKDGYNYSVFSTVLALRSLAAYIEGQDSESEGIN